MSAVSASLREKLANLPSDPGCYLFKDETGLILYVGKAVNLKNRVRSYFQKSSTPTSKTRRLVAKVRDVDVVVVGSELEALILECNLIKQHRPQFNVRLRDDKQYPYLMLTCSEPFPRLLVSRKARKDGNKYFGPYTNSGAVWDTMRLVYRLFPLVTCRKRWDNTPRQRPCLYHHMGRCPHAPCAGMADPAQYQEAVDDVALFLEGKQEKLVKQLRDQMEAASEDLEFERAARLRDQIVAVEQLMARQRVVAQNGADQDVVAVVNEGGTSAVQLFFIRNGKLVGQDHFLLDGADVDENMDEAVSEFVKQYYQEASYVPREIILPTHLEETEIIEQWLRQKKGRKVVLTVPERGEKKNLLDLAATNARQSVQQMRMNAATEHDRTLGALMELQEVLSIDAPLERIEAFDISTIQGAHSVGGMVVFEEGKPAKAEYRRFRIKLPAATGEPNDFAMMREMITRRLKEGVSGNAKFSKMPDLMLIDGGKGQLGVAVSVAGEMGVAVNMIGLAKQFELVYQPEKPNPLILPRNSQALFLLQRIRDEVHRFSVTYHRTVRAKNATLSVLDEVRGIGPARRRALLQHFGSMARMKSATVEQLAAAPRMNRPLAAKVHNLLHSGT